MRNAHEKRAPMAVEKVAKDDPLMKGFPEIWKSPGNVEEVYIAHDREAGIKVLAKAFGAKTKKFHPVIWTHKFRQATVFGMSLGHETATFKDAAIEKLLARAVTFVHQ